MHTTNIFVANGVDDVNVEGLSAVTHTHTQSKYKISKIW